MPRTSALTIAAIAACVVLTPMHAHAQWWSARGPADFEECADAAEKAATKEDKTFQLSECHSKFAGRRKPGGGYTFFDFMQNRNFDIAGPNPTPEEQKQIDEQYIAYLDDQRRSAIAAAFSAKQQQVQQVQPAAYRPETERTPLPPQRPKSLGTITDLKSRGKNCPRHSFSCEWPRLSESFKDIKKVLFGASQGKANRS
jgi:hypothetical protein